MFVSRDGSILRLRGGGSKNSLVDKKFSYFTYSREALIEILKFNKISSNDEVLLPNYLCSTVIESIIPTTKNIKYYEIDEDLSFNNLEISSLITDKTKLIMFVDYFGVQAKVDKDLELVLKSNNILIVKDAAHSFLSLVNESFKKDYNYDYLISSIYKNLPLQVGCIAVGKFNRKFEFINFSILVKRYAILFLKNILCFFGQQQSINRGISNISISDSNPVSYFYGLNVVKPYKVLLFRLNLNKIIFEKQDLISKFNSFFSNNLGCNPVFTQDRVGRNILQAYPILFSNQSDRDLTLNHLKKNCIDAYTWPTFHETNCDDFLWGRILLLPLDVKVLEAFQSLLLLKK
jgi:hypothetical protein